MIQPDLDPPSRVNPLVWALLIAVTVIAIAWTMIA